MTRRRDGGESETRSRPATSRVQRAPLKNGHRNRTMKLGGGGLSLEAFAAAKSRPFVSHTQVREQREFYENAKKVQKYKRLVSQLGLQSRDPKVNAAAAIPIAVHDSETATTDDSSPGKTMKSAPGFANGELPLLNAHEKQNKARRNDPRQQKCVSQMEKERDKFQTQRFDELEIRREREELAAEQQQAREKAKSEQKVKQAKLRKRTDSGQPVMKHRVEQLLEIIQRGL